MIPIHTEKTPRTPVHKDIIPLNMGSHAIQQQRVGAKVVGQGIKDVGAELVDYAQKHKNQDIATDQAAYALYSKQVMTDAENAAKQTQNPDEVHQIYQQANQAISDYITGSNAEGTPNIRWRDHQDKAKLAMSEIRGATYAAGQRRVMDIYKTDSIAKHKRLGAEFIQNEDLEGLKSLGPVMRDSGLYTPEEVNLFLSKGEMAIEENTKAKGYNQMTEAMSQLAYQVEMGQVSTEQEIDALRVMQTQVENTHEDYHSTLNARIYSRLSQAYRSKKYELNQGFKRLATGLNSGSYKKEDLDYFLAGRVDDYDDLVLVAEQAGKALSEYRPRTGQTGAIGILQAVNQAATGEIAIADAISEMKESNSRLAPLGLIMLGGTMMADDSGADPEAVHNNWTVKENTFGPWNKEVKVSADSVLHDAVRMMGIYVAEGDESDRWVEKTFFKAVDIQNDPEMNDAEKRKAVNELFKERALDTMSPVKKEFVTQEARRNVDIQKVMDANPSASRSDAIAYLQKIGRW